MNRGSCLPYLFVVVRCFLPLGMLTCAAALSVSLEKIFPEGNPVVGDIVILRCNVSNLQAGHVIEWARRVNDADTILAHNGTSLVSRYAVYASLTTPRYEHLVINTADKQDTGQYQCNVKSSTDGSSTVLLSRTFYLSVHYFPADMYPICAPQGSFIVQQGTTHHISCTSEKGNPTAQMDFESNGTIYPLDYSNTVDTQTISLDLSITAGVDTVAFECKIASPFSFPNMERSCIIGPIHVSSTTNKPSTAAQTPTSQPKKSTTFPYTLKTTFQTSYETSSSYDTPVTKAITDVKSSMQPPEAQTSKTDQMTTTRPRGTGLQAATDATSSNVGSDISVAIIAGIAGGGGFLLLLLLISIVIACACLCGLRGDKKEKHLLQTPNSTRPNTISRPSSGPPVRHHSSSSSHKHANKETSTAAEESGRVACPASVKRAQRPGTPKPRRADMTHPEPVHDSTQTQPNTWELNPDRLESHGSGIHPSDTPTLRISSHREHTQRSETSYAMLARGTKQEPLYAELQKSKKSSAGKGAEKVHVMETGADSSVTLTNPTYASHNHEDTLPAPQTNGTVKTKLESPAMKQVTWKT